MNEKAIILNKEVKAYEERRNLLHEEINTYNTLVDTEKKDAIPKDQSKK